MKKVPAKKEVPVKEAEKPAEDLLAINITQGQAVEYLQLMQLGVKQLDIESFSTGARLCLRFEQAVQQALLHSKPKVMKLPAK